jgi:IS4 transposase
MNYTRSYARWKAILPHREISAFAKETGFAQRQRKLTPDAFLWGNVVGFGTENRKTLSGITRFIYLITGVVLTRQALHKRYTPQSVGFFRRCYSSLLDQLFQMSSKPLPGNLGQFEDIYAIDSTTIRLADRLARRYPACRSNVRKSALKIHSCMSLSHKVVERLRFTAERVHDRVGIKIGNWVRDRLLTFDLAYFDYGLLKLIVESGGAFVARLKDSANGVILTVRSGCSFRSAGKELNHVYFDGGIVDLDVMFGRGQNRVTFRVVGLWNPEARNYHWYITSLNNEDFSAEEIGQIYRLRWQIELLFKEWKSLVRIHQINSSKENVVLSLVLAALCAVLLSRIALLLSSQAYGLPWHGMSTYLALALMMQLAKDIAEAFLHRRAKSSKKAFRRLLEALAVYAKYPNTGTATQRLINQAS